MLKVKKDRLQATKDRARYRAASIKLEAEAKIVSLQERAAKAEGGIKARLERLANEVRVDYVNRATTLNLSWKIGCQRLPDVFSSVSARVTESRAARFGAPQRSAAETVPNSSG